jgi:hypothetical protein
MAERLRSFDFSAQSAITSAWSKGRNRYPWNEWFDGDIWKITQGEDFDTSPLMMERIIRTRASNKNHKAKVTLRHIRGLDDAPSAIVLQRTDIVGPSEQKKIDAAKRRADKKAAATADATKTLAAAGMTPKKLNGKATNGIKPVSKRPAKKAPVKV